MNPYDYYTNRQEEKEEELSSLEKKSTWISRLRLFIFLLIVGLIYAALKWSFLSWGLWVIIALVLLFLWFIYYHIGLKKLIARVKAHIDLNREEVERLSGCWSPVYGGEDLMPEHHGYARDLDVFGDFSLFEHVNRSPLVRSRQVLAERLLSPADITDLQHLTSAYKALSLDIEWCQQWIVATRLSSDKMDNSQEIADWMSSESFKLPMWLKIISWVSPIFFICLTIGVALNLIHYSVLVYLFVFNLIISGLVAKKLGKVYQLLNDKSQVISEWVNLFYLLAKKKWADPIMSGHLDRHTIQEHTIPRLKQLLRFIELLDAKNNILVSVGLNGLLFYDVHLYTALERWKGKHSNLAKDILHSIADIDVNVAFGVFTFNRPDWVFPSISENFAINAKGLGHPLLNASDSIKSDMDIDGFGRMHIITGSNMSGKSTWLRTVGLNLVLANAGAPVCAHSFQYRPIDIVCSMRISDNLAKGESTFYVELKRLKNILNRLQDGDRLFVILDEILRGTNSKDKLIGSKAFVSQILQYNAAGMVATHDLELGELENDYPSQIQNFSFEVEIKDQQFMFDYKIKHGICKTLNASELMQKMGIKI